MIENVSLVSLVSIVSLVSLVIVILTHGVYNWISDPWKKYPSPESHFILKHLVHLRGDHVEQIKRFAIKFRDKGLYMFEPLLFSKRIVLLSPKLLNHVLKESKVFIRPKEFFPLIGKGIVNSVGESHAYQRRILNPVFSPQQLKKYVPTINKHAAVLIQNWKDKISGKSNGERIMVFQDFTALTFDIIGDVGFGYEFNSLKPGELHPFPKAVREAVEEQFSLETWKLVLFNYFPFLRRLMKLILQKQRESNKIALETMDMLIEKRKNEIQSGKVPASQEKDILSMLLNAHLSEENSKMTSSLIRDNVFTLLLGGQSTSRTVLTYTLHTLAVHQDIQEKLCSEVKLFMTDYDDVSFDNLKKCSYLDCVIKECLRLPSTT